MSIVIVAFNSRRNLERCLPSIVAQDVASEVIVVDNASEDGVVDWLHREHPQVRVLEPGVNLGFPAGVNEGIAVACGRFVLVLNPDTILKSGALRTMLDVALAHPGSLVNPMLLLPNGTLNACGNSMQYTGISTCIGLGEDPSSCRGVQPVPLVSGAAVLADRADWLALEGFDPSFFLYHEDTDLSLRARLRGFELLCVADAAVLHDYALKMNPTKFYCLERNRLLVLFKVYEKATLIAISPGLLLTECVTWLYAALKGWSYLAAKWRGYTWLWRHRRDWSAARRRVQAGRQVRDGGLLAVMSSALPIGALLGPSPRAEFLERLSNWCYRPVLVLARRATERE